MHVSEVLEAKGREEGAVAKVFPSRPTEVLQPCH